MVDFHLVSWNRPEMTELVIWTIHRNTKPNSFRLNVFDNGSDENTVEVLRALKKQDLIFNLTLMDTNVGLERARQELVVSDTHSEFFVDIDNDCLPPPVKDGKDWLERMLELMERYEDYAAISQRTQVMIGTGNIFEDDLKDITPFPHPGGSFRIMRTDAVKEVGGWEREASGRGAEERYIGEKLRNAGYKTGFATHIKCLHLFGDRNQTDERWGYKSGMKPEDTGHSEIWHPALENGDDFDTVAFYSGKKLAMEYFKR